MRFEKGRSGNPGGRPKGDGEIRELARQHTMTALLTLVEIAEQGQNESARVAAANALLDRGWGKPAVPIVATDLPPIISLNLGPTLQPRISAKHCIIEPEASEILPLREDE